MIEIIDILREEHRSVEKLLFILIGPDNPEKCVAPKTATRG
jgi:hypothetical protein